jgi:hypothetical protein
MKIKLTDFALRHFDKNFGATKILDITSKDFENEINIRCYEVEHMLSYMEKNNVSKNVKFADFEDPSHFVEQDLVHTSYMRLHQEIELNVMNGYAPFCKLLAIKNFTNAKVGSSPITIENYQYLRSGYSARRESELPVFSRWLELPVGKPKAEWLVLVLYDKKQINVERESEHEAKLLKEHTKQWSEHIKTEPEIGYIKEQFPLFDVWKESVEEIEGKYKHFDADWGVVAILGQNSHEEEPMQPSTILRNALGIDEGGSGVPLDREAYLKSVDFWEKNATVK